MVSRNKVLYWSIFLVVIAAETAALCKLYHWVIVELIGSWLEITSAWAWWVLTIITLALTWWVIAGVWIGSAILLHKKVRVRLAPSEEQLKEMYLQEEQERLEREFELERKRAEERKQADQNRLNELMLNPTVTDDRDYKLLFPHACPKCGSRTMTRKMKDSCYVHEIPQKVAELSERPFNQTSPWQLKCFYCDSKIFSPETPKENIPTTFEVMRQEHSVAEGDPCDLLTDTGITLHVSGEVADQMLRDYKEVTLKQTLRYLSPYLTREQSETIPKMTVTP